MPVPPNPSCPPQPEPAFARPPSLPRITGELIRKVLDRKSDSYLAGFSAGLALAHKLCVNELSRLVAAETCDDKLDLSSEQSTALMLDQQILLKLWDAGVEEYKSEQRGEC